MVEKTYHFTFPEDYFQFITQAANGGAGPDYGIMPFEDSLMSGAYGDFQEAYKRSLETPFAAQTAFLFWEPTDANGILASSYPVSERGRYSPRTMKERIFLRRTAFMNFIRSGLIGFLIQRMSKKN